MNFINKLIRDEQGATAIEYGLIAALIAVAAITAMTTLGDTVEASFVEVSTEMQSGLDANP
jgi:pilus assembly protein Flp/PilA